MGTLHCGGVGGVPAKPGSYIMQMNSNLLMKHFEFENPNPKSSSAVASSYPSTQLPAVRRLEVFVPPCELCMADLTISGRP